MTCESCKQLIGEGVPHMRHHRLGVYIHLGCPTTNIKGEDITTHTMEFFNMRNYKG